MTKYQTAKLLTPMLVGLHEVDALKLISESKLRSRITVRGSKHKIIMCDRQTDRINLVLDDTDVVTAATVG